MHFVRTSCRGYLIFFYESFGDHRGLFPKVPYAGADRVRDLPSAEDFGWRAPEALSKIAACTAKLPNFTPR